VTRRGQQPRGSGISVHPRARPGAPWATAVGGVGAAAEDRPCGSSGVRGVADVAGDIWPLLSW
jgi:hypothetical protein